MATSRSGTAPARTVGVHCGAIPPRLDATLDANPVFQVLTPDVVARRELALDAGTLTADGTLSRNRTLRQRDVFGQT